MTLNRGDIGVTRFPHAGGNRGKKRSAVIIQADVYNAKLKHFIVAEISKNLAAAADPASFLIEGGITKVIGKLSDSMKAPLDACLKTALQVG